MAQGLLSKVASAAEYVALPGAILWAYFATSRATEPKRDRYAKPNAPKASGNSPPRDFGHASDASGPIEYDDGQDHGPPWHPKDRW